MIYIKNNTEIQTIFIPRSELQKEAYIASTKTYEDGYKDGFGKGKQHQKDQLLNLYVTENGQYEREDGWGVVTVDIPTGDCPEGGSCNLGEGEIYLTASDAGFYELYAADDGYDGWSKFIVTLENGGAIKVFKAEELIQMFNEGWGIDFGAYYYVGGAITEIQEVNTQYGNATYTLDNGFSVYRGKWFDGTTFTDENQIKVGAYIVVYGIIQDYNGTLQFKASSQVIAYQECEGGEIVSCNLEDKWVTPSMDERDGNGLIVVNPSEGYDGMSRTVIDPQTIYNEGVEAGKAEGGEGGSCNLGILDWTLTEPYGSQKNATDDGYDGYEAVVVRPENIIAQQREEAINEFKNQMREITITENGTYSIDDTELRNYIEFDGNSYFDTNIPFGENTKIEVAITKTSYEKDEQVIGVAHYDLLVAETYGAFGIVLGPGLAYGVFGKAKTNNIAFSYEEEQILTFDRNGIKTSFNGGEGGWIDESGLDSSGLYGQTIGLGKIKSVNDGWSGGFNGLIRYVKIWTDGNDDSTMTLFRPKNMAQGGFGMVNSEGTEYNYVENIGDGITTFVSEWVNPNPFGWRHIDVNVDTQAFYNQGFADATSFNKIAMEIETDVFSKLEFLTDYSFVNTSGENSPKSLMFDMPINYIWSYRDVTDGIAELRQNAFKDYSKIRKVKINTIMRLGERAFKDAFELREIDMSNLIGYIATEAFDGCSQLAKIICRATGGVVLGSAPFNGLPENGVLYLTEGIDEAPWLAVLPNGWTVERL